ncbi:hypothetical protein Ahia01_000375000, partial [Argonauta hians]
TKEMSGLVVDDDLTANATVKELEDLLDKEKLTKQGVNKPGRYIFELLSQASITDQSKDQYLSLLERINEYLSNSHASSTMFHVGGFGVSHLYECLQVYIAEVQPKLKSKKMDSWVKSSEPLKRELNYWCFSAGHTMLELQSMGLKCMILTSGTLSPIDDFASELQIPFPVVLQNPHIIQPHQVCVEALPVGPDNFVLNSSYDTRFDVRYLSSLGNAIVNFSRLLPHGLLIFFPSYSVMEGCVSHWKV